MLTTRQIEIADILLKNLKLKAENPDSKDYIDELNESGYSDFEINILIEILISNYNLVYYHMANLPIKTFYLLTLTPKGNKAAKKGINSYLFWEKINNEKTTIISITALIVAFIALFK
jgi:hypothetical protein